MKHIYKYFYAFMFLSLMISCEDAIDIEQPGRLGAENAFKTISDLRGGLLGAYNFLDTTNEIGFTSAFTDETFRGRDNGGQNLALQNFSITSSNAYVQSIWISYYSAINLSNTIIKASQSIDRTENSVEYDNVLGQAYAIRAFSHFKILTYFSTDYTDDSALAGLLVLEPTTDVFANVARNTNGEFYSSISSDLSLASNLISSNEGIKFMGQDFITALKARIATYRGQYAIADGFAASLLARYPIATQTQFFNMYDDSDFTEVIFSLERSRGDSFDGQGISGGGWAGSLFAFIDPSDGGGPFMEISRSVFNLLNGTTDVRLPRNVNLAQSSIDAAYTTNGNFINDDVLLVFKYPGSDGQPLMNDLKVFRSAEMLLIRAEAAADANRLLDAATIIKTLRDARFGVAQALPVYPNQEAAFGDILDERRIELLFEGHRWVDLKRLGSRGSRGLDRDMTECALLSGCTVPSSDFRFTLPIPLSETTANSAIVQNAGY